MKQQPVPPADAPPELARNDKAALPDYDPVAALAGIREAGGSWHDLDAEALKADLYRAREDRDTATRSALIYLVGVAGTASNAAISSKV